MLYPFTLIRHDVIQRDIICTRHLRKRALSLQRPDVLCPARGPSGHRDVREATSRACTKKIGLQGSRGLGVQGFRVQGFIVKGSGSRVLGFGVQSLCSRVQAFGVYHGLYLFWGFQDLRLVHSQDRTGHSKSVETLLMCTLIGLAQGIPRLIAHYKAPTGFKKLGLPGCMKPYSRNPEPCVLQDAIHPSAVSQEALRYLKAVGTQYVRL